MVVFCKRCGRKLTSAKSIKLGYGPTCYKKKKLEEHSLIFKEELKFLKVEIKMLKKIIRELKPKIIDTNIINSNIIKALNFIPSQQIPITRIIKEESQPNRNADKRNMREVIQELKTCFQKCNGDIRSMLSPIQMDLNHIGISNLAKV
ncbi:MAG: hypothetical protein EU531_07830 [Promethearchaeota archaeon]|nr:MAG: hypothetical protein EU531_07830 [Candidatus Lokiarchaeota archaeon]